MFFLVIVAIAFFVVGLYNKLVRGRNQAKNSFSQIGVQLQRRFDLIPNLVEIAKKYMAHEKEALQAVIEARSGASKALDAAKSDPNKISLRDLRAAEEKVDVGLGRLIALAEDYPDLKANQNMMQLTEELTTTENKVSFARQAYNDSVMSYNNTVESFPSNLLAGAFGFLPMSLYEVDSKDARKAVAVSFDQGQLK